jgi:hypothetical protein
MTTRRGFITGFGSLLIAAPAIVRASSIMPVKAFFDHDALQAELAKVTREALLPRFFAWNLPHLYKAPPPLLFEVYDA